MMAERMGLESDKGLNLPQPLIMGLWTLHLTSLRPFPYLFIENNNSCVFVIYGVYYVKIYFFFFFHSYLLLLMQLSI